MKWLMVALFILHIMITPVYAADSPPPRMRVTMFYDPIHQQVLLFGGARLETSTNYHRYNDLWSYDYATDAWRAQVFFGMNHDNSISN
jgi:hypothetical protein